VAGVLDHLLNGMTTYGPLVLGLAMLPGAVGFPVPVGTLLVAAGALVRQGIVDWRAVLLFAWVGAMVSDALCYTVGRGPGRWARDRLSERYAAVWERAEELFGKHGGWAVFTTGWLIRSLAVPTTLIAGSSRYPFWRFLAWDGIGKLLLILLHAGLGYAFASQWRLVSETIGRYGIWLGLCGITGVGIYLLVRRLRADRGHAVREAPNDSR
jgi:membrane protein DedA with SNARE-associated domain